MVNVLGGVAAAVSASLLALGFASPAWADEFSGIYTIDMSGKTATWAVTPCGGDSFTPCVHVAQTGGEMAPWQADAYLSVGYWTLSVDRPDTISCDDGQNHPAHTTYSWDAVALSGWLGAHDPGVCGGDPKSLAAPFTLTKVAPAVIAPPPPAEAAPPPAEPAVPPPAESAPPPPAEAPLGAAEMAPPPAEAPPADQ